MRPRHRSHDKCTDDARRDLGYWPDVVDVCDFGSGGSCCRTYMRSACGRKLGSVPRMLLPSSVAKFCPPVPVGNAPLRLSDYWAVPRRAYATRFMPFAAVDWQLCTSNPGVPNPPMWSSMPNRCGPCCTSGPAALANPSIPGPCAWRQKSVSHRG